MSDLLYIEKKIKEAKRDIKIYNNFYSWFLFPFSKKKRLIEKACWYGYLRFWVKQKILKQKFSKNNPLNRPYIPITGIVEKSGL